MPRSGSSKLIARRAPSAARVSLRCGGWSTASARVERAAAGRPLHSRSGAGCAGRSRPARARRGRWVLRFLFGLPLQPPCGPRRHGARPGGWPVRRRHGLERAVSRLVATELSRSRAGKVETSEGTRRSAAADHQRGRRPQVHLDGRRLGAARPGRGDPGDPVDADSPQGQGMLTQYSDLEFLLADGSPVVLRYNLETVELRSSGKPDRILGFETDTLIRASSRHRWTPKGRSLVPHQPLGLRLHRRRLRRRADGQLADKRVAIIGTGATAVQCIPHLARVLQGALRLPAHAVVGRRARQPADRSGMVRRDRDAGLAAALARELHRQPDRRHRREDLVQDGWTDLVAPHPRADHVAAAREFDAREDAGGVRGLRLREDGGDPRAGRRDRRGPGTAER